MIRQILLLALATGASYFFTFRYLQPNQTIMHIIFMCARVCLSALLAYKILEFLHFLP